MAITPMTAASTTDAEAARVRRLPHASRPCMATEYEPSAMAPALEADGGTADGVAGPAAANGWAADGGTAAESVRIHVPHLMQNMRLGRFPSPQLQHSVSRDFAAAEMGMDAGRVGAGVAGAGEGRMGAPGSSR